MINASKQKPLTTPLPGRGRVVSPSHLELGAPSMYPAVCPGLACSLTAPDCRVTITPPPGALKGDQLQLQGSPCPQMTAPRFLCASSTHG